MSRLILNCYLHKNFKKKTTFISNLYLNTTIFQFTISPVQAKYWHNMANNANERIILLQRLD